jgi:hypothetical protein
MTAATLSVERLARTLCRALSHDPDKLLLGQPTWRCWEKVARRLIDECAADGTTAELEQLAAADDHD